MPHRLRFRSRHVNDNDFPAEPNSNESPRNGHHQRLDPRLNYHRQLLQRRRLLFLALILFILATIPNPFSILSKPVVINSKSNEDNRVRWRTDQLSHCPDSKVQTIFDTRYKLPSNNKNGTTVSTLLTSQEDSNPEVLRIPPNVLINSKSGLDKEPEIIQQNVMRNLAFFPGWKLISDDDSSCLQKMKYIKEFSDSSSNMAFWFISDQTLGMLKSDICRLAQLYLHGGVYLDNDLELTSSLMEDLLTGVEILSALELNRKPPGIFQAILGSPPGR